jgi:hypothetical protein
MGRALSRIGLRAVIEYGDERRKMIEKVKGLDMLERIGSLTKHVNLDT